MIIDVEEIGTKKLTPIGMCEIEDYNIVFHQRSKKIFVQYLYKDLLKKLADDMHQNVRANYDNVILATGGEGSGKSSLMYQILKSYKKDWNDATDIEQSYTYNMDLLRERFAAADWGNGMFWMDETTQIASNRDWQSDDNKDFVSVLETFRSKKFLFGGCAPKIERVDIYLRDFRMRYRAHCQPVTFEHAGLCKRGIFELFKRDDVTGEMRHIGYGRYDPIPAEADAIYQPLKEACQDRLREKIANRNNKGGAKYERMYKDEKLKNNEIMLQLHDRKLLPDSELMDMFGYTNRGTFQNTLSKTRSKQGLI